MKKFLKPVLIRVAGGTVLFMLENADDSPGLSCLTENLRSHQACC